MEEVDLRKVLERLMAFVLVVTLATSSVSINSFSVKAEEVSKKEEKTEVGSNINSDGYCKPEVVEEVVSDRTTDSTTFLLSNGMKQTTYYSDDIYFENEKGELAEYDSEFVKLDKNDRKQVTNSVEVSGNEKDKYSYVNNEGDSKQFLPNKLSEKTPIVMAKKDYVLSFAPTEIEDENSEEKILAAGTKKISLNSKTVTSVYDGSSEEKKIVAYYEGKNEATELSYESLEHGLKETITLNNKPENNVISFNMTLQGSYAKVDEVGGGITLYSEDDDIVGGIEAPFMNDATENNYSEDIYYELTDVSEKESDVHKYILKLVVDEKYLENASYPVMIDPTITWNGATDLPEAYVLKSSASTNYFSSGVKTFSVGKGSQGVFRTYFRARKLASTVKNKYIDSATLTVYENGDSVSGSTIYLKPVAASFKCSTVNWNNQPGGTSATLASFKSNGKKNTKHEINLKTWAQNVAKSSGDGSKCYGLLFKASNESSTSYVRFYGARATSYKPQLKVVYYDGPTEASSVSAKSNADSGRNYIKDGEKLKVSWSGISSHALSYVEYRIANSSGNTLSGYEYSTLPKIGTTASGSDTINVGGLKDGTYRVYVRGVDKGGIEGKGKYATFYVDKTKPVFTEIEIEQDDEQEYSNEEPTISYSVQDNNFYCVQIGINGEPFINLSYDEDGDEEITGLISGQPNEIRVRAVDKAGNVSDVKGFVYCYDSDDPIINASISPNTNCEKMDNSKDNPILKYTISDKTLKSYEIELNDENINVTSPSGQVELKNVEEGKNIITITAEDKAENDSEQKVFYYRDTIAPEKGTVRITPKTGFFNSSNQVPLVKWDGITDDNLLEVQIKINDGDFKTLGINSSGEALLSGSDFTEDGKYTLTVRGIDKAGNVSEEIKYNYYYETKDYELEDYTPINVYAIEQLGGNTVLRFSTKNGKYRDDVKYQVYRSTTPNVVINEKTFVKECSSKGSIKISGDDNVTYYYKIRAVKKSGNETLYSDYSEEISSTTIGMDEKNNRLGTNTMYTYSSISTPNGTGQIELSKGNFYYEQNDISLPAVEIPVNISRRYNSNSSQKSMFGYGWCNEYDAYVSECGDKIYYTDGTRAVYTFSKKDNKYECVENPDLSLEIDDDVLTRKIEDSESKITEIEADVYFKITDKNGENYRFDDAGRLVLIEETKGSFVYITYDERNIKSVTTNRGQQAKFEYNSDGLVSKITAGNGAYSYSYTYDNDYLTKATYVGTDGKSIDYKYAYTDGMLTAITDAEGNEYAIVYKKGSIVKFINTIGEETIYNTSSDYKKARVISFNGSSQSENPYVCYYTFNENGQIIQKTDILGNEYNYTYDENNRALLTGENEQGSYYALVNGVITKKTSENKNATEYNKDGNVTSEKDELGNVTTYEYSDVRNENTKNKPTQTITKDASGKITSNQVYVYDEKGNILIEKDLVENTVSTYKYNADGTVSKSKEYIVSDADKVKLGTVENAEEKLEGELKTYDENTEYNDVGDELSEKTIEGTVKEDVSYEYDKFGNVLKETDNNTGTVKEYKYDSFFRNIETKETIKKQGKTVVKVTKSSYNKNGSVIQSVDENGRITESEYDALNRVVKTVLKVGEDSKTTRTAYSYGNVRINKGTAYETISNVKITTVYNNKNEIESQSFVDYDGRTVKELSNGLYIDYTYDASGRVFTEYTNGTNQNNLLGVDDGKLVVKTYDEKGNQTATITNPDITGNTFKVGNDSIVTKNEYDQNGNVIKSIDGEGNQTKYEYDEQGRKTKVITPSDSTNTYSYDELTKDGNDKVVVDTVTDALGRVSKTTNNGSDQITKIEDIASTKSIVKTYEYDSNGRQTKEIYSDGSYTQNTYEDATGELIKSTKVDDSGNVESYTQYEYTVDGKVKSAIDYKNGKSYRYTYYEYDAYGRNTGVAEINATSTPTTEKIKDSMLKYVYNVDDNIEKIYYPNSSKDKLKGIKFVYNKDKWITEIDGILSGGDNDITVIRKYDYYSNAKVRTIRDYKNFLNKGTDYIQRDYSYDKIDRVVSMAYFTSDNPNTVKEKYEYKYDKNSNITYKHETSNYENSCKDEEVSYFYDEEGRLVVSRKHNNLNYKMLRCIYKYDKVGNKIYEAKVEKDVVSTDQSKVTGYYSNNSYNDLNQLTESRTTEIEDGSEVKTSSVKYSYDSKGNRILSTDDDKKTSTVYKYDVSNQLVYVETTVNGAITFKQHNEYNGQGQRISKTDTDIEGDKVNSETTNYYYEGSLLLYTTDGNGNKTSQNLIGNENNAFATIRYDSDVQSEYFYSKDVQGSVVAILNNNGECEQSYSYADYGETQKDIDSKFYNEICYTSGIYDENTELYYLNSRYYDANESDFLSQDTYRGTGTDANTWNLYAYCAGNPVNYVDPSGHWVVGVYIELQAACVLGGILSFGVNANEYGFNVTVTPGFQFQVNASASVSVAFVWFPHMKSLKEVLGWGLDLSTAYSWGAYASAGVSFDFSNMRGGAKGSVGASASLFPVTLGSSFTYTKEIGYESYKSLDKMRKNQTRKKSKWGFTYKYTKKKNYVKIKVSRFKRPIRYYYKRKVIKL